MVTLGFVVLLSTVLYSCHAVTDDVVEQTCFSPSLDKARTEISTLTTANAELVKLVNELMSKQENMTHDYITAETSLQLDIAERDNFLQQVKDKLSSARTEIESSAEAARRSRDEALSTLEEKWRHKYEDVELALAAKEALLQEARDEVTVAAAKLDERGDREAQAQVDLLGDIVDHRISLVLL